MSYTPTEWSTGDTITAALLNKMENGIAGAGGGYDAVIRLTHSNDSGEDTPANLTPSIESGTYAGLYAMLEDAMVPDIRIEYYHPYGMATTLTACVTYYNSGGIFVRVAGYLPMSSQFDVIGLPLVWDSSDGIAWND